MPSSSDSQRFRRASEVIPLQRRLADLEAILSVTRAMAAEPDLTRLLVLLASACTKVLHVERSSIWVVDPNTNELFTRVAEGSESIRVPGGAGIVGAVQLSGEALIIPDAYADARFNPEVDRQTGFTTRNILCVPLHDIEGTRVVGVIQALNKNDGAFQPYNVELAMLVAAQAGVVLEQAALREHALERQRLQEELNLARNIQQRLLPRENPVVEGLQIAGMNRPATETSGDYFDYVTLSDGRWGLIVADVTGHGLGAALIMTAARAFVRALCGAESNPGRIAGLANDLLEADLEAGNFLSLCLAAFDPRQKTLHYASAGHDPPLVFRPAANEFAELESTGPLLGVVRGMDFQVAGPLPLQGGDILLFMTDGLFECMNAENETFGKERIKEILRAHATRSASELLEALLAGTAAWVGECAQRDDITVVVVKVEP